MSEENQANEFYKLFKRHLSSNTKAQLRIVNCVDVDWDKKTMKAVDNAGLMYFGISLGFGSVCVKPKKDAICVIGLLENQDTATWLVHTEMADEIVMQGGAMAVKVSNRLMVKNDKESLRDLLLELLKSIKRMTFTTNVGPTISLVNVADFMSIEKRLDDLLK